MKKILTASLVAIMAVTAANADIASTKYVDDAKSAALTTAADDATAKANTALADAKSYADDAKAEAIQTAGTNADTKINALRETVTANTNAINSIDGEITEIIGDINAINNAETGALAVMKTELEGKITTAQNTADGAVSVNAEQKTAIEKNAADIVAMDAAYKKADSDAKTAADNAYAAKSYETIVDADKAWRESIQKAATGSVAGNYALTAKVDVNGATSYTWELISR